MTRIPEPKSVHAHPSTYDPVNARTTSAHARTTALRAQTIADTLRLSAAQVREARPAALFGRVASAQAMLGPLEAGLNQALIGFWEMVSSSSKTMAAANGYPAPAGYVTASYAPKVVPGFESALQLARNAHNGALVNFGNLVRSVARDFSSAVATAADAGSFFEGSIKAATVVRDGTARNFDRLALAADEVVAAFTATAETAEAATAASVAAEAAAVAAPAS